ncbi:MAG: polyprenyl synthetase family protein [Candidatus Krumholzibacteriia bacterium]
MTAALAASLARERRAVEARLRALLAAERGVPPRLRRAMAHSLFGGGKRLRPVLLLWAYDACRERGRTPAAGRRAALDAACALEFIHTYSLIHDDLPAMDDDVLRRGRPTCHVAFDEPTAILAGDGLQALAFGVLARLGPGATGAAALIARAAGPAGMVGGQQDDLDAEGVAPRPALIRRIQRRKTAALLAAALAAGADLAGASASRVKRLLAAGDALGLAFQQADDLLDACGSAAVAGKSVGKDAAAGKLTWVRLEGTERARRRAERDGRSGLRRLGGALPPGPAAERLLALAAGLWVRDR